MRKLFALISLSFALFSCGNPATEGELADSTRLADSFSAAYDRTDINHCCCFQNEKEFDTFFPSACGNFSRIDERTTNLYCLTDTLLRTYAVQAYADGNDHNVVVYINDYCNTPDALDGDYILSHEIKKNVPEFNEFDGGSYYGFTCYDKNKQEAYLIVVVDKRFTVEILDQVCENTKNVLAIYKALPLTELSEFGK